MSFAALSIFCGSQSGARPEYLAAARELAQVLTSRGLTAVYGGGQVGMFYSIWKHRKSKGAVAANWHESTTVEIIWTVIPFIIILVMALPATRTVVAMKDTSNADVTIKVTGYQWKWGYDYLRGEGEGISFLSQLATPIAQIENREPKSPTYLLEVDNPLVVPVNKKVRIILTASDVIHGLVHLFRSDVLRVFLWCPVLCADHHGADAWGF